MSRLVMSSVVCPDVTLHHPFACGKHEYEVVIEAPKAKDIPTQEEFDKVRAEVDITETDSTEQPLQDLMAAQLKENTGI